MKLDYEAQLLAKDREWDRKVSQTAAKLCDILSPTQTYTVTEYTTLSYISLLVLSQGQSEGVDCQKQNNKYLSLKLCNQYLQ